MAGTRPSLDERFYQELIEAHQDELISRIAALSNEIKIIFDKERKGEPQLSTEDILNINENIYVFEDFVKKLIQAHLGGSYKITSREITDLYPFLSVHIRHLTDKDIFKPNNLSLKEKERWEDLLDNLGDKAEVEHINQPGDINKIHEKLVLFLLLLTGGYFGYSAIEDFSLINPKETTLSEEKEATSTKETLHEIMEEPIQEEEIKKFKNGIKEFIKQYKEKQLEVEVIPGLLFSHRTVIVNQPLNNFIAHLEALNKKKIKTASQYKSEVRKLLEQAGLAKEFDQFVSSKKRSATRSF